MLLAGAAAGRTTNIFNIVPDSLVLDSAAIGSCFALKSGCPPIWEIRDKVMNLGKIPETPVIFAQGHGNPIILCLLAYYLVSAGNLNT